jgi:hypothetical protein
MFILKGKTWPLDPKWWFKLNIWCIRVDWPKVRFGQILEAKKVEELWNHNLNQITKYLHKLEWSKGLTTSRTKEFVWLEFIHK